MSTLRVPVDGLRAGTFELDAAAARYVARVHRLGHGDSFVAFDPQARLEAEAVILRADRKRITCEVKSVRTAAHTARRPLWLLQALSKGDRFDQVVRDATALGGTDIVAVACARCDVVVTDGSEARRRRWGRVSVEASRQCGRGDTVTIHPFTNLAEAIAMVPADAVRVCLWENATRPLRELQDKIVNAPSLALFIGPEGGLEQGEVEIASEHGFEPVSMGPFILRTETAATAVLGAVRAWWG
jgi:16S rRNA (uracil1498-N3)-methyltransferase